MAEKNKIKSNEVETIVEREFVGDVTPIQAILPIVLEDIRKKAEENCSDFGPGERKRPAEVPKQRKDQIVLDPGNRNCLIGSKNREVAR